METLEKACSICWTLSSKNSININYDFQASSNTASKVAVSLRKHKWRE